MTKVIFEANVHSFIHCILKGVEPIVHLFIHSRYSDGLVTLVVVVHVHVHVQIHSILEV
jgi:hypothetical protein